MSARTGKTKPGKDLKEHILVCLSSAPSNANIIRTAAKMAKAFDSSFTAMHVKTSSRDHVSREDELRLADHIRLAEKNGAVITTVAGDDVAWQVAEFARLERVTKVVLGRSAASQSRLLGLLGRKTLSERLIDLAPNLDVYIIPDEAGANGRQTGWLIRPHLPTLREWIICIVMLLISTAIGLALHGLGFSLANVITLYIMGSLIAAMFTRSGACAIFNSIASALLFSFFFAEPQLSLRAYASHYPVTLAVMVFGSMMMSTLAKRAAAYTRQSVQSASRTKVLFETNQLLQKAADDEDILRITASQLLKLLNRNMVVYSDDNGQLGEAKYYSPEENAHAALFEQERNVAAWVLQNKRRAGAATDVYADAKGMYLAIRSGGAAYGVVGVHIDDRPLEPFVSSVMLSILGECALAMENSRNAREKEQAAVRAKDEQLRADLLRAISHDLRTPLTSISGNAENLLSNDETMSSTERRMIASDIYADAIWLIQLVENLLSITRISEGRMQINLSMQLVEEVITESLRHIGRKGERHVIRTELADDLLLCRMDARLISQVILNLVDNAIKYTPAGSEIIVSACQRDQMVAISVTDNGPGMPDEAKEHAFTMFYTDSTRIVDCRRSLGLGLSLCRSIVKAHGGEITLKDNDPHGCVFEFTLPVSEVILNE